MTVYLLHDDLTYPLPIPTSDLEFELEIGDEEQVVALKADPLKGEDPTIASRFRAEADQIPENIKSIEDIHGHMHITVDGTEYEVAMAHDHGEDAHDHGHDDAHDHGADEAHDDDHAHDDKDDKADAGEEASKE